MLLEEKENHISASAVVRRVHRHLSEEILDVRHDDGERAKSVPEVVESEYSLVAGACRLVFEADKGSSQLNGVGHVFLHELVAELEHMSCSQERFSVFVHLDVRTEQISVSTDDFLVLGVPYDKLLVRVVHGVELVEVERFSRAPSGSPEYDFTQSSDFADHIWGILPSADVYLIIASVRSPQFLVLGELRFQEFHRYWWYNIIVFTIPWRQHLPTLLSVSRTFACCAIFFFQHILIKVIDENHEKEYQTRSHQSSISSIFCFFGPLFSQFIHQVLHPLRPLGRRT